MISLDASSIPIDRQTIFIFYIRYLCVNNRF